LISYQLLLEALADGVFVAQDHRFVFCNPALPALLGYQDDEFIGLHFNQVVAPDYLKLWTARYEQRIGHGQEPEKCYEVQFLHRDGQPLWVELRANRSEFKHRPAVLGIIRDISQRKQAEAVQQQLKLESEIGKALVSIADNLQSTIGHELHENLGQQLSGILYLADSMRSKLPAGEDASTIIVTLVKFLQGAIAECRNLSEGLGPTLLRTHGLTEAINALAGRISSTHAVRCHVEGSLDNPLDQKLKELQIYRIVQEATGVAIRKHGAKSLAITLAQLPSHASVGITIKESAPGSSRSDTSDSLEASHNTMRYRASLIGATLDIAARPEGGAHYFITFSTSPINAKAS